LALKRKNNYTIDSYTEMREHPTHVMKDWDIKPDFYLQIINCIERKKDLTFGNSFESKENFFLILIKQFI